MRRSNQEIIRHKVGLLNLAEEPGNVSQAVKSWACHAIRFTAIATRSRKAVSRHCWRGRAGFPTLMNRVDLETEEAVVAYAVEYPAHGQVRVSNELRKRGVLSPGGVRSIWLRHDLAHFKARLKALEARLPKRALSSPAPNPGAGKEEIGRRGLGEIDTAHPGYLGSQDTVYVGTLKGVGRV